MNKDKERDIKYFQNKVILNFSSELKKYEPDDDLPYMLFGSFALLMSELVKNEQKKDLLNKANLLIEEMAASENEDVKDLFMVGFLEVFADEASSVEYSRKHFSSVVNNALDIILNFWEQKK